MVKAEVVISRIAFDIAGTGRVFKSNTLACVFISDFHFLRCLLIQSHRVQFGFMLFYVESIDFVLQIIGYRQHRVNSEQENTVF